MKKKKNKVRKNNQGKSGKALKENQKLVCEGKVVEALKHIMFHVCLDQNNQIVLGYLSGNMRRNRIRVILGDRVLIEVNDYDSKKGRIIYRLSQVPTYDSQITEQIKEDKQAKGDHIPLESSNDTKNTNTTISNDPPQSTDQE